MRILVTGGKGQLGKWLVRILKEGKSEIGKIPEEYKNVDVVIKEFLKDEKYSSNLC